MEMRSTTLDADDILPPPQFKSMLRLAGCGVAICALAAGLDVAGDVRVVNTLRLILTAGGLLLASVALTKRPGDYPLWFLAAAAFGVGSVGLPTHYDDALRVHRWDSAAMLARVICSLAIAGGLVVLLPRWRYLLLSVFIFYHFGNMLTATTLPDSRPWVSNQLYSRVYMPYMRFMYLSNAYHFYSPEPGPSSYLFWLVTWETGKPTFAPDGQPKLNPDGTPCTTESAWVDLPRRDIHYTDPLGLGYYRRLSVTELVSNSLPSTLTPSTLEKQEAIRRRQLAASPGANVNIPLSRVADPLEFQYRIPRRDLADHIFPAYARHVASFYSRPDRKVVKMKLYRVEHRVVPVHEFLAKDGNGQPIYTPYTPTSYRPYYMGEFSAAGELLDPQDPMLYWLTPILTQPNSKGGFDLKDYMSIHAGFNFVWKERP